MQNFANYRRVSWGGCAFLTIHIGYEYQYNNRRLWCQHEFLRHQTFTSLKTAYRIVQPFIKSETFLLPGLFETVGWYVGRPVGLSLFPKRKFHFRVPIGALVLICGLRHTGSKKRNFEWEGHLDKIRARKFFTTTFNCNYLSKKKLTKVGLRR